MGQNLDVLNRGNAKEFLKTCLHGRHIPRAFGFNPPSLHHLPDGQVTKEAGPICPTRVGPGDQACVLQVELLLKVQESVWRNIQHFTQDERYIRRKRLLARDQLVDAGLANAHNHSEDTLTPAPLGKKVFK